MLSARVSGPVAPPTSVTGPNPFLTFIPGISTPRANALRDVGRASIRSLLMTALRVELCTSTVGVSPVTVTVSCSVPTRISAFTVVVAVPASSTPSRLTTEKLCSVKVTV